MPADIATLEEAYQKARTSADRLAIAVARGRSTEIAEREADTARATLRTLIGAAPPGKSPDPSTDADTGDDAAALAAIRRWLDDADRPDDDLTAISTTLTDAYAAAAATVDTGDATLTRLAVLERLRIEPDPAHRRHLFEALAPVWRTIDGDGSEAGSPYRRDLLPLSARRWAAGPSPVDRNARALGIDPDAIEPILQAVLGTWREAYGRHARIEPWDWWYASGEADRALAGAIPIERLTQISDAYHASLGADPGELPIHFDVLTRADRPQVPVAYTDFGDRGGAGTRPSAWVFASYSAGGLGELTELVHETGHAIHLAAIDTRPAYVDWPDSDALTEAIAELAALDTAEPAWQEHWLGASVPEKVALRGRYAEVVLDICWALLELRLHADPSARPNDVWADLTSEYLGIIPHPELSWWAMRGQLIQEPGYMLNYALGPILAADMRAGIRTVRGNWTYGDLGWYGWVSEHILRFGTERSAARVLADLLGRPPSANPLIHEILRGADAV